MKMIDMHGHLINWQIAPEKVFAGRWSFSKQMIDGIAQEADKSLFLKASTAIYNLFADKDIDPEAIIEIYFRHYSTYAKHLIKAMDEAGIDQMALLGIDFTKWDDDRYSNEIQLAILKTIKNQYPDRFLIFMGIDPSRPNAPDLVREYLPDFDGVKIYPAMIKDFWLLDNTAEIFQICNDHKKPMTGHHSGGGIGEYKDNSDPKHVIPYLDRHQDLHYCFAHGGGNNPKYKALIRKALLAYDPYDTHGGSAFIDTAYQEDAFFNPVPFFADLRQLYTVSGNQIMIGSDYLFHTVYYSLRTLTRAFYDNLFDHHIKDIGRANALCFLRRS